MNGLFIFHRDFRIKDNISLNLIIYIYVNLKENKPKIDVYFLIIVMDLDQICNLFKKIVYH